MLKGGGVWHYFLGVRVKNIDFLFNIPDTSPITVVSNGEVFFLYRIFKGRSEQPFKCLLNVRDSWVEKHVFIIVFCILFPSKSLLYVIIMQWKCSRTSGSHWGNKQSERLGQGESVIGQTLTEEVFSSTDKHVWNELCTRKGTEKTRRKKNNSKEGKETKNKENTRQSQQTVPGRGVLIEPGDKEWRGASWYPRLRATNTFIRGDQVPDYYI